MGRRIATNVATEGARSRPMIANQSARLLSGPSLDGRPESFASHLARLGEMPARAARRDLIEGIEASGLLGRGGAGFPTGRKWRAVAERAERAIRGRGERRRG